VQLTKGIDARGWQLLATPEVYSKFPTEHLSNKTCFHVLCKDGDLDLVQAVLERTTVDINADDGCGNTPLHWAARYCHIPVVQYLCEQGANKNVSSNVGKTALHWASDNGGGCFAALLKTSRTVIDCLPVMRSLCDNGADIDARDTSGWTPLHLAVFNGHLSMVQYLCEQGADKQARSHRA